MLGTFIRTEFLCISVLRVASGPRVKLAGCKRGLNFPVVYSTDRSKVVVLVLFLLFVALWFLLCFLFCFFLFFCINCDASIVVTVFNSCPLCLPVVLCCYEFGHRQQMLILLSVLLSVIKSCIGTPGEVSQLQKCLDPSPNHTHTPRWFIVLTALRRWCRCWSYSLLLCGLFYEAICFKVLPCLFYLFIFILFFFSCVFSPFSIAITSLGEERELILVIFVLLSDLCLFGFVCFLFLLVSGKGFGL